MKYAVLAAILMCTLTGCASSVQPDAETSTVALSVQPDAETSAVALSVQPDAETSAVASSVQPDAETSVVSSSGQPGGDAAGDTAAAGGAEFGQSDAGTSVGVSSGKSDMLQTGSTDLAENPISEQNTREDTAEYFGALSVGGTKLTDAAGNPVQLKGISTHGLAWYPEYVNEECFGYLKEDWGINVIRLAMYTAESGGYCTDGNRSDLKALVKSGVEYATECGMYVIIDWHILSDGNPNMYIEEAKEFFKEMSGEYANYENVLYEICNEPNGGCSWSDVKGYAEEIIAVIRENDEDGIILVGTPNWCQYVEQAAEDPIEGFDNIMYTLHFYAATHTDDLRGAMARAIGNGLPVFVSEYGICDASGSGAINADQAEQWINLLDEYQVSYVAWNLSNKGETSAILKTGCNAVSGFTQEDLSDSGKWLYRMLGNEAAPEDSVNTPVQDAAPDSVLKPDDVSGSQTSEKMDSGGDSVQGMQGGMELAINLVNSWAQNGETYYQYTVDITNSSGEDCRDWTISIIFSTDISLSDGWNGSYQVDGNVLYIQSMDYNGYIAKGGNVGDIGFIVYGAEGMTVAGE